MNVSCTNCGKRYVLSDDKVAGKSSVKIRCKQCQSLISIDVATGAAAPASGVSSAPPTSRASGAVAMAAVQQPTRSPWEDEATKAMPALDLTAQWHAMIGGVQQGPFDVKTLMGKVSTGEVTLRTYLWKAGMADWKRASDVAEVSSVFAGVKAPPPPPGPRAATGQLPAVPRRDVAVANEMPSPEVTRPRGGNVADPLPSNQLSQPAPHTSRGSGATKPVQAEPQPRVEARSEPEPEAPSQETPAPEPKAEQPLNDLFGEVSKENATSGPSGLHESPSQQNLSSSAPVDPFAALGELDDKELPPPGEATKFFIAQAGVNKRNPPWKIALFIFSLIGLPTAVLYLLSTFNVVQLPTVTRTTDDGQVVQESFFSPGGVTGLKDILTGDAKRRREEADRRERERLLAAQAARDRAKAGATDPEIDSTPPPPKIDPKIAADYAMLDDPGKTTKGPRDREKTSAAIASSGLKDDVAAKVVTDNIKSFNNCIEEALRRNPNLKVGSITVKLTVGASGAVTRTAIDPSIHENTDWGACMLKAGKRIVFPSSDGETDVLVPLKLGVAM